MPRPTVDALQDTIRGWARRPGPEHRSASHGMAWVKGWFEESFCPSRGMGAIPLVVAVVAIVGYLRGRSGTPGRPPFQRGWLLAWPVLLGLVVWFLAAPDPRHGWALFWTLAALGVALALVGAFPGFDARSRLAILGIWAGMALSHPVGSCELNCARPWT